MAFETAPVRGVEVHYGVRTTGSKFGGAYGSKDGIRQEVYTYDATDLPAADGNNLVFNFPANTVVLRTYTEVVEDIAGLTSPTVQVEVGSYDSGEESLSSASVGGFAVDETAANIGSTSAEMEVTLGGSGTATAGKLRTIVEYVV